MMMLLTKIYYWIVLRWTHFPAKELSGCETLLDLGCGNNSLVQYISVPYSVGVDLFQSYLEESQRKGIHSEYILADITKVQFKENSFDNVFISHVLEHMSLEEGYELIGKAKGWSKKKVVVSTPNGFLRQDTYDNNPWQTHKSGWRQDELKGLDFKVYGLAGWKSLRGSMAQLRFKPTPLWRIISAVSQLITYFYPQYAFELFGIWQKQPPKLKSRLLHTKAE